MAFVPDSISVHFPVHIYIERKGTGRKREGERCDVEGLRQTWRESGMGEKVSGTCPMTG